MPARPVRRDLAVLLRQQKNVADAKNAPEGAGDVWTWVAIDADTKLVPSWLVGGPRSAFMHDPRGLSHRIQLTTEA